MHKIYYPIYVINEEPEEIDGLLLIGDQVVDDKNMPGKTLGMRRLQTPMRSLYPLRYQLDDEVAMMKHRGKHFIDSNGVYWYDEKTTTTTLKYHKIRKVEKKDIATVIWLKDIPFPFNVFASKLFENSKKNIISKYFIFLIYTNLILKNLLLN